LVPVIGLVQVGEQSWADRYTYLPSIGLFVAVVWGVSEIAAGEKIQTPKLRVWMAGVAGSTSVVAGNVGAAFHLRYWRNTRTLFEHAEKVTKDNYMAIALAGSLEAVDGKLEEGIERYRRALEIRPSYAEAHYLLGEALERQGKTEEAISEFRHALTF